MRDQIAIILFLLFLLPINVLASDSHLVLYNSKFNEILEVPHKGKNGYDEETLTKISHIFRSPDGKEHQTDALLIELLEKIQNHFKADVVEIISGYRSPEYNNELKKTGRTVADESLHMQGLAADIHIDEITEKTLWNYVKKLKRGGAGFYPDYNFVHVDIGRVRNWEESVSPRKLIGAKSPIFISDKNVYLYSRKGLLRHPAKSGSPRNDIPTFTPPLTQDAIFERFVRGQWQKEEKRPLPFGKYRATSPSGQSNEFYIKRK